MSTTAARVQEALVWLERKGSERVRSDMRTRYGIIAPKSFGVPVSQIQVLARRLGKDHALAAALWKTGWYEARLLTAYVDEPALVTAAQMDAWVKDFDNWGVCDTLCFSLFDRTPHAWRKIEQWHRRKEEFVKRTAFALLACVALHDKDSPDAPFIKSLAFIERAATDDRNFVRKGVSWALRSVGRRSAALHAASLDLARRLADSDSTAARTTGKEALRDLAKVKPKRAATAKAVARRAQSRRS